MEVLFLDHFVFVIQGLWISLAKHAMHRTEYLAHQGSVGCNAGAYHVCGSRKADLVTATAAAKTLGVHCLLEDA